MSIRSTVTVIDESPGYNYDLTTLAAVKAEFGITTDTDDALWSARITRASRQIAEACDRVFALENVIETFWVDQYALSSGRALILSRYPVVEMDSVLENDIELDDSAGTLYELDAERGMLYRTDGISPFSWGFWGTGRIVVTYSGGYDLPEGAPSLLEQAAIELVRSYQSSAASALTDSSIRQITREGVGSITYATGATQAASEGGLPDVVANLIAKFKRPIFA